MTTRLCLLRLAALPLAVGAAWPAASQTLLAQAATAPQLRDTVVTATRVERPLADLVADVSIVDRDTIERSGAVGVADLLARLPGAEISRNGGQGSSSSVFLRGAESRFTAVYIDGVRVDSQTTGGAMWEQIPLAQIDRIEVLRGPAAAVYGSDAIGGVIQLFTKKGEGKPAPYAQVGLGSRGTRTAQAGVSGGAGMVDYSLGISHERSDGFNARTTPTANPDDDGYRRTSGNARVGLQIDPRHRIEGTLLASNLESQYDNSAKVDDRNHHQLRTGGLSWAARWSDSYTTRLQATTSRSEYRTTPSFYETETTLRNYLFQNEWRLGAHLFTAALERREDELRNPAASASATELRGERSQNALALGYGVALGAHSFQANLRRDDDSEFGGKSTGSLAYGLALTPQWRATVSAGTSFRAPTLYQRFSEYGVATLQPESGRNIEAGLRWTEGDSSVGVVAYRNRVRNLINFGAPGTCANTFGCYESIGRAEYSGVTLSGSHRMAGVNLRGSIDWQDPRDLDTGRQLARRAKRHASLGADTELAGWTWGAEVQASGRRFNEAANTNVLGGYGLVNLYASTRVARDFTLLARVENLSDKRYETARTYATEGRTLYVGLKWAPQ
ncbi:TonB-dependent receptor domain-containing protein [Acidovorax sp. Leaf160]|uniref:TonB-dependent receptor domain-containing protein n=1 Tax=Acidovorax sp. Leaf160 TaxID=1736280 RepID=UPI0006F9DFEA|nr:TonB-dependent receptor [Acidovorax sp. Leaf160]KQR45905.1 TonB-dependent receptor [Acidovorax sp. Leaf160]